MSGPGVCATDPNFDQVGRVVNNRESISGGPTFGWASVLSLNHAPRAMHDMG